MNTTNAGTPEGHMYEHWDDSLSLGFPTLDAEHKSLFEMVEEMKRADDQQPAPGTARQFLERLVNYRSDDLHAMFHDVARCSQELAMWLQEHRAEHNYLADRARAFMAFSSDDERTQLRDLHSFLSRWLSDHLESNLQALRVLRANGACE